MSPRRRYRPDKRTRQMRRVALQTDSGATVYAHINDETTPETIDALKAIGDAVMAMTDEQIEALQHKRREHVGLDHNGVMRPCVQDVHFCWGIEDDFAWERARIGR